MAVKWTKHHQQVQEPDFNIVKGKQMSDMILQI